MEIVKTFTYNEHKIDFDLINQDVMINATEMAKPFGKRPVDFLSNQQTNDYIDAAIQDENFKLLYPFQSGNYHFGNSSNIKSSALEYRREMIVKVIKGGDKNGTWMHRHLALKFAAWLSPDFELWVWKTIDEVLYGHYKKVQEINNQESLKRAELETLHKKQLKVNPDYVRIRELEDELKSGVKLRKRHASMQMDLFRDMAKEDTSEGKTGANSKL